MKLKTSKKLRELAAVLLVLCMMVSLAGYAVPAALDTDRIERFERLNPVYCANVEPGTPLDGTGLPDTLRAVFDPAGLGLDTEDFVQAEPEAAWSDGCVEYDYYAYGYVRPADAEKLYAAGEPAVYSVYYEDPESPGTVGEIEYRVYGSAGGDDPCWFTCDEQGNIDGVIRTVPAAWDGDYDGETEGTYTLTAVLPEGFRYNGDAPTAEIIVMESSGDECEDETAAGHEDQSAAEEKSVSGDGDPAESGDTAETVTGKFTNQIVPLLADGGGSNSDTMVSMMKNFMPTISSNTDPSTSTSSGWTDYVNTIWWNKGFLEFEWTTDFSGSDVQVTDGSRWSWSGIDLSDNRYANQSGSVSTNPLHRPSGSGGTWEVYSGEQLRYALNNYSAGDTVRLMADIDLNGMNYNWEGIYLTTSRGPSRNHSQNNNDYDGYTSRALILDGSGHTIYNFGQVNGVGFFSEYGELTMTDLDFTTACVVLATAQDGSGDELTYAGIIGHTSNNGAADYSTNENNANYYATKVACRPKTFDNVDINASLIAAVGARGENGSAYDCYVSPFTSWSSNVYRTGYGRTYQTSSSGRQNPISQPVAEQDSTVHHVTGCSVNGCFVYGSNHVNGFSAGASQSTVANCFSQGNLICGTGKHSAGFVSCNVIYSIFTSCFAANDFYGTEDVAGFVALSACCEFENCYSTGKVEGYHNVGGFVVSVGNQDECGQSYINNCYSTALVSLRSSDAEYLVHDLAGFYAQSQYVQSDKYSQYTTAYQITNCYAAGEVGNYDTDNTTQISGVSNFTDRTGATSGSTGVTAHSQYPYVGGFIACYAGLQNENTVHGAAPYSAVNGSSVWRGADGDRNGNNTDSFSSCYYDKQTTAMREWVAGDVNTNPDVYGRYNFTRNGTTVASLDGVTGVLTSDTDKGGTGLAGGSYGTDNGFAGFSDNRDWIYSDNAAGLSGDYYPQLSVFYNADPDDWGDKADLVRAYSLASTSTVFLDTWDDGYTWDETGVRSPEKSAYDTDYQGTYRGYQYTYDTVREIISDFTATGDGNDYTYMINPDENGAYTSIQQTTKEQHNPGVGDRVSSDYQGSVKIENGSESDAAYRAAVNEPGVEWYRITRNADGSEGTRPIRLIAYMHISAGVDQVLNDGDYYDHRDDVRLVLMDRLADNLVVGWDDGKTWAEAVTGGYPLTNDTDPAAENYKYKYDAVPVNNLEGYGYTGSSEIWTEIWVARPAGDGQGGGQPAGGAAQAGVVEGSGADSDRVYTAENGDLWQEYYSVYVSGSKAGDSMEEEQTWIGELPHSVLTDGSGTCTYIVSYYWMLEDGRYINDYKIITLEETHNIRIQVRDYYGIGGAGSTANSLNGDALNIGLGMEAAGSAPLTDQERARFEELLARQSMARTAAEQAEMEYLQQLIELGNVLTPEEQADLERLQEMGDPLTAGELKELSDLWTRYNLYTGVSEDTAASDEKEKILSGTNVTFGWSQDQTSAAKYRVRKIQVDYHDTLTGESYGSWSLDAADIDGYTDLETYLADQCGNGGGYQFTIAVRFEAAVYEEDSGDNLASDFREELRDVTAYLTYEIVSDGESGFTLTLNKYSCYLDNGEELDETDGVRIVLQNGDDVTGYATLNDLFADVTVTLWVTWGNEIYKIDGSDVTDTDGEVSGFTALEGAVFILSRAEDGKYYAVDKDGKTEWVSDRESAFGFRSDADGRIGLPLLDPGQYSLQETESPEGYTVRTAPWIITVDENGELSLDSGYRTSRYEYFLLLEEDGEPGRYQAARVTRDQDGSWSYTVTSGDQQRQVPLYMNEDDGILYRTRTAWQDDDGEIRYTYSDPVELFTDTVWYVPDTPGTTLYKIDGSDAAADDGNVTAFTALEGAEFILYRMGDGSEKLYRTSGDPEWSGDREDAAVFRSNSAGRIELPGLEQGTYYLQETTAPEGYTVSVDPWMISVQADGTLQVNSGFVSSYDFFIIAADPGSAGDSLKGRYDVISVHETGTDGQWTWSYGQSSGTLYFNPDDGLLYADPAFTRGGYRILESAVWYIPDNPVFTVYKIDGSDVTTDETTGSVTDYTALEGAQFVIMKIETDGPDETVYYSYFVDSLTGEGEIRWVTDIGDADRFSSQNGGEIRLPWLPDGDYGLKEVTAPGDEYLILAGLWEFTVSGSDVSFDTGYETATPDTFIFMTLDPEDPDRYSVVEISETDGEWSYTDESGADRPLYLNTGDGRLYTDPNFSGSGYEIMRPTVWYIPNYLAYELPSTAGRRLPLIWFAVCGTALMLAGGCMVWVRLRRRRVETDLN